MVNHHLHDLLSGSDRSGRLISAMSYSLMAGGKRLRPILCLAANDAVRGDMEDALPAACALEMIHTYSLIHDDLPAMDDDELRRGRPTCHVRFDEATAILAGDALLTFAFEILSSTPIKTPAQAQPWLKIIHEISRASGFQGMVEGQMRDIQSEGKSIPLPDLVDIHRLKTGALIQASVCSGAILGNGNMDQIRKLRIYADNIGLAFQIVDDILNIEGDPALMGKAVGTDESRLKSTYPSLLGISESKGIAAEKVNNALQALEDFDNKSDPLRKIAEYIVQRNR